MSSTTAHLTEETLEQMVEGTLSATDRARAASHLEGCARCGAELDAYRALFAALGSLPRFAPSEAFADAVMARVRIAPAASSMARLQRWLPQTRRGWMMLSVAVVAPALPVIALAAWLFSQPLVTVSSLWQWAATQLQQGTQAGVGRLLAWGASSGLFDRGAEVFAAFSAVPLTTLGTVLGFLAVAIPLSAWSLVRLTRTPIDDAGYAN